MIKKYIYKDKKYNILVHCDAKNPSNGEWISSVVYYQELRPTEVYCRDIQDFHDKFKEIK